MVTLHKGQSHGIEASPDGKLRFLAIGVGGAKRKYEVLVGRTRRPTASPGHFFVGLALWVGGDGGRRGR